MDGHGCLVICFLSCFIPSYVICAPSLQFSFGTVRGVDTQLDSTGEIYYAYYGIPFAQPPVGGLRFQPPQPFVGTGANTVITSNSFRAQCPQAATVFQESDITMSEDCLHLNVFTPVTASTSDLKKVMVFIHGGGYTIGSADFYMPGSMVVKNDVIIVTIQYRLGVLGFLSSGDDAAPGNNGLRDQQMSLKWVKDNIRQFGGDPNDVTIFGESAGASSVSLLSLSPASKGLFNKGIMQSGTALSPWAVNYKPGEDFYRLAKKLDCAPWYYLSAFRLSYNQGVMDCMRRKSAQDLVIQGTEETYTLKEALSFNIDWAPVVDGDIIPRSPWSLLNDKDYLKDVGTLDRSYVIGFTNLEGAIMADLVGAVPGATLEDLGTEEFASAFVKASIQSVFPLTPNNAMLNMVDFMYTFPRPGGQLPLQGAFDLATDVNFAMPSVVLAKTLNKISPDTDIFMYLFDHYPEPRDPDVEIVGTTHAMDLFYQFDFDRATEEFISPVYKINTPAAQPLYDVFRGVVTSFAKTGNPSPVVQGGIRLLWPRFELLDEFYMAISANPELRQRVYARRTSLWTEFLPRVTGYFMTGRADRVAFKPKL